jgi:hypothetical protein
MKKTNRVLILGASFAMLFAALSYGQLTERPSLAVSTGAKVAGGPFVVGVTSKTATVVWLVQSDEVALTAPTTSAAALKSTSFRIERTTFTGLQPNTRYDYNIGSAGNAGRGSFKTAPASSSSGPYRFLVYGDTRTRHDVHRSVMAQVMKHALPDFVVHTGDLVADGNDNSLWPIFFDIEANLLRQTAFFPSLGNHERNTHYFRELFQEGEPYYSFDWGNAHFTVLNSDIANFGSTDRVRDLSWTEQRRWIEDDLAAHQKSDYRFVVAHHPPMTAVASRQGNNPHMTALIPLFEKYRVTAGLFGHDHNYQHYLKNGVHYIITGGGGAPLYDVSMPPEGITQKVVSVENFLSVDVGDGVAHLQAIAIDGKILDDFQIPAPALP